jgi:predicted nucleic acid-binding protein
LAETQKGILDRTIWSDKLGASMHVFIDTNILLNFFHFSKDELESLNNIFASHEHGAATVHLTRQVCDEFRRNRENKIKDALKRFNEVSGSAQLPSFMKDYEEYKEIRRLNDELQVLTKSITQKINADIHAKELLADKLILDIFSRSQIIEATSDLFATAQMRIAIGNPPGKNSSLGDAINWEILLHNVPSKEPLHIISADGDFYSSLNENAVNPFLEEEWKNRKESPLYVYRTLSGFMKKHFDGVAFTFDRTKATLIDDLFTAKNFATTHQLIRSLENYSYFSLKEVERILAAAIDNNQFGGIATDIDVSNFLYRVAVPQLSNITNLEWRGVLQEVLEDRQERLHVAAQIF